MKIIDFKREGNTVTFYLGDDPDYTGDDWDDVPYEHNAGKVYDEYIKGEKTIEFNYNDLVIEPSYREWNSKYSKNDMKARKVPCIIVISRLMMNKLYEHDYWIDSYKKALKIEDAKKYYFGDDMDMYTSK